MNNEVWKVIKDYEKYSISSLGKVKNNRTGRILKVDLDKGYCAVNLYLNTIPKKFRVHRLVAQTHILNPENKPQVNHKDGNKQNNNIKNLEWCTNRENIIHGYRVLGRKSTKGMVYQKCLNQKHSSHPFAKPVLKTDLQGNILGEYKSIYMASKANNISTSTISDAINRRYKHTIGFIWTTFS